MQIYSITYCGLLRSSNAAETYKSALVWTTDDFGHENEHAQNRPESPVFYWSSGIQSNETTNPTEVGGASRLKGSTPEIAFPLLLLTVGSDAEQAVNYNDEIYICDFFSYYFVVFVYC